MSKVSLTIILVIILAIIAFLISTKVLAGNHQYFHPSPSISPSPSVTVIPCDHIDLDEARYWHQEIPCISPSPSPSESPSASPEASESAQPSPSSRVDGGGLGHGGDGSPPGLCVGHTIINAPTIITFKRLNPTTVHVEWTASDKDIIFDYSVRFGLTQDKLVWGTMVHGLSTDLGNLPANQMIWIQVIPTDNCILGPASTVVDP